MACPYFYPVERHTGVLGTQSAILPLGDAWSGVCRAATGPPRQPEEAQLLPLCSFGYVRGRCDRFPKNDTGPDAIRFTIASDDGSSLGLYYVMERDHHPFAHGPLEYSLAGSRFLQPPADETFARQAEAYALSYLRRKTEALVR
jgi:hypothetical protein